jgi:hypothetical protein
MAMWFGEVQAAHLQLTWIDNSSDEWGFKVERRIGSLGGFSEIVMVGVNVSSYTDSALAPATTYCYRVRAFNAAGASPYSNEACGVTNSLVAAFESPETGQPVSGVGIIQGWAFDVQDGTQISSVKLFIDGQHVSDLPCCSEREDVQATFPEFPVDRTRKSGWGAVFNWGLLSSGRHTLRLEIRSTGGAILSTETRTVSVVKPGGAQFLDRFDLSGAVADIVSDRLIVEGVRVRDKISLQEKEINVRFRWFSTSQSLQAVQTVTVSTVASLHTVIARLVSSFAAQLKGAFELGQVQAAPGILYFFESPQADQIVSGIAIIHGWAFADEARASLSEVRLLIDEQMGPTISCCSPRGDVAAVYPDNSNALNSGWGITVNYGDLTAGFHTIGVLFRDTTGNSLTVNHGITALKIGGFDFLDQFELSEATAWIEGEEIVIAGVAVRDKTTLQTRVVTVRLRWSQGAQALKIVASTG